MQFKNAWWSGYLPFAEIFRDEMELSDENSRCPMRERSQFDLSQTEAVFVY